MRVTGVINRFPPHHAGGYGLRFGDIMRGLRRLGHRTSVVTSTAGVDRPVLDAGGIHRVLSLRGEILGVPGVLDLARATRRDGRRLARALRSEQPDVILVGNFFGLSSGLWSVLRAAGSPLVLDVSNTWLTDLAGSHGNWYRIWEKPSRGRVRSAVKRLARGLVAIAGLPTTFPGLGATGIYGTAEHVVRSAAEAVGPGGPRPVLCPSGIDLDLFPYRPAEGPPRRLLYVGRLKEQKGVHTAVDALGGLPEARLTVVGIEDDADYARNLRSRAEAHPGRVQFRPAVPREELAAVFHEHDVLVFPTTGPEAFSRLILEAMACGLPVVATPNGGTAEAIDDGVNGLLYPPGDVDALVAGVRRLEREAGLRERLIRRARKMVEERYGLDGAVRRIEGVLATAASGVEVAP